MKAEEQKEAAERAAAAKKMALAKAAAKDAADKAAAALQVANAAKAAAEATAARAAAPITQPPAGTTAGTTAGNGVLGKLLTYWSHGPGAGLSQPNSGPPVILAQRPATGEENDAFEVDVSHFGFLLCGLFAGVLASVTLGKASGLGSSGEGDYQALLGP